MSVTFQKRQKEMKRQEKQRAKAEKRALKKEARRAEREAEALTPANPPDSGEVGPPAAESHLREGH